MNGSWRALRRRLITPNAKSTKVGARGFHVKNPVSTELLETVGSTFLQGYGIAAGSRSPADATPGLDTIAAQFRGFGYEGAAMGFAMVDALRLGPGGQTRAFLDGPGRDHVYMAYVGIGWAMARLPRIRWGALPLPDPLLRWLALDGYGFHQAYFRTARYVHGHARPHRLRWPEHDGYAANVVDQGIGRAMWFVAGTDVDVLADLIERFPPERRADLYSGAGLAATYAGGADEDELARFVERAGEHRPQVAQGAAFAAVARVRAGLVVPHTRLATQILCGTSPDQALHVTEDARRRARAAPDRPAYATWRRLVADEFVSLGRC